MFKQRSRWGCADSKGELDLDCCRSARKSCHRCWISYIQCFLLLFLNKNLWTQVFFWKYKKQYIGNRRINFIKYRINFFYRKKILRKIICTQVYSEHKICRITVRESLGMDGTSGDHLLWHPAKSTVNNSSCLGFFLLFSPLLFTSPVHSELLTV